MWREGEMKSGKPKLAPKVKAPNKKSPNFMRESDEHKKGKSPMFPMKGKQLAK